MLELSLRRAGRLLAAAGACLGLALVLAPAGARAQQDPDLCYNFANAMIAGAVRGQQAKCPDYRGANMNWNTYHDWCSATPPARVRDAAETANAKLDGCLISAEANQAPPPPPPPMVQAAPPPPVAQAAPARGKSFYVVPEGADVPRLCVDVPGGKLVQGAKIQLWQCHGKAPQRFGLDLRNGRIFVAANPGLCVDGVPKQQLELVPCQSTEDRWYYDDKASAVRTRSGMCWDIFGGNKPQNIRQRARVFAWPCHGGRNQQFVFND